jgi:hypothetical protein
MTEFHQVLLPKEIVKMQLSILMLMLMHTMPMTTMYMVIVLRTITVTLPRPPMVTIDLICMAMKAKQKLGWGRQSDADVKPNSHAHDAHDNNVHGDSAENDNSDIASATNGEDRPELHNHEGQAVDQLPEEDENNGRDVPFDDNKMLMVITMLRMITMRVTGSCHWHSILPINLTQRTSTRYYVSP